MLTEEQKQELQKLAAAIQSTPVDPWAEYRRVATKAVALLVATGGQGATGYECFLSEPQVSTFAMVPGQSIAERFASIEAAVERQRVEYLRVAEAKKQLLLDFIDAVLSRN